MGDPVPPGHGVGGQDDGGALPGGGRHGRLEQPQAPEVEPDRRLVEEEDPGPAGEDGREGQQALAGRGELVRVGAGLPGEADGGERLKRAGAGGVAGEAEAA